MSQQWTQERCQDGPGQFTLEETDGGTIVRGVCLCGNFSGNGYEIPKEAFGDQAHLESLYDGKPIFADHKEQRSSLELAGTIFNVRMEGTKPYCDLRLINTFAGKEAKELFKSKVKDLGMSHMAQYEWQESKKSPKSVKRIRAVKSVDIVMWPATTHNFSEQQGDSMTDNTAELASQISNLSAKVTSLESDLSKCNSTIQSLTSERDALKAKVDQSEMVEQLRQRRLHIESRLTAAGLPVADKSICSDTFVDQLMNCPEETVRESLIQDRKTLCVAAIGKGAGIVSQERKQTVQNEVFLFENLKASAGL